MLISKMMASLDFTSLHLPIPNNQANHCCSASIIRHLANLKPQANMISLSSHASTLQPHHQSEKVIIQENLDMIAAKISKAAEVFQRNRHSPSFSSRDFKKLQTEVSVISEMIRQLHDLQDTESSSTEIEADDEETQPSRPVKITLTLKPRSEEDCLNNAKEDAEMNDGGIDFAMEDENDADDEEDAEVDIINHGIVDITMDSDSGSDWPPNVPINAGGSMYTVQDGKNGKKRDVDT